MSTDRTQDTATNETPVPPFRMPALSRAVGDALALPLKSAAGKSGKPTLKILFDGSCPGNPGPMGIGLVVLENGAVLGECAANLDEALGRAVTGTNIRAEMVGLVAALELATRLWREAAGRYGAIEIAGDSEFAVRTFHGANRPKDRCVAELAAEARRIAAAILPHLRVRFHARTSNARADRLAQTASGATATPTATPAYRPRTTPGNSNTH